MSELSSQILERVKHIDGSVSAALMLKTAAAASERRSTKNL